MRSPLLLATVTLTSLLALAPAATAQQGFGPLDPTPPTGITVDQLIQKMGARETEFAAAREQYTYRQDVKFNTISDDTGRPDGEYRQVTDVTFDKTGKREEHVTFAPQNTIERVIMTENDIHDFQYRLPFILTSAELPEYNFTYLGRQKVDDLDTYVLAVAPREIVKGHRYFQGKAWLDTQDDEIVLVNGLNVPQIVKAGHEDLSPPFTTYYEQIDGKYWFPTYTKAEGTLHFAPQNGAMSQDIHVMSVVHYTDYKKFNFHSTVTIHYGDETLANPGGAPDSSTPSAKPQSTAPPQP